MSAASSVIRDLEARRDNALLDVKRLHSKEEAELQEHSACLFKLDAGIRRRSCTFR